jgi:ribosomal protein L34E
MNKDLKEIVSNHVLRLESLENEKKQAKKDLAKIIKLNKESITDEFIDWYYWETDSSVDYLAEAIGVTAYEILKRAKKPIEIEYECPQCKKKLYEPCDSRSAVTRLRINLKKKKHSMYYDELICPKCLQENMKSLFVKKSKKNKKIDLENMDYHDFLQTSYWKKFSQERRKQADFKCTKCGRGDLSLHVHHLTYERRGHELNSDVTVLCEACHLEIHNRPVPKYMIINPVSLRDRALKLAKW